MNISKTNLGATFEDGADRLVQTWQSVQVPLRIESPIDVAQRPQPITVGIPLPKGRVWERYEVSLNGPVANGVPVQATPLATWPDGSIKWLLLEFLAREVAAGVSEWTANIAPQLEDAADRRGFRVQESPEAFVIDTGTTVFEIDRQTLAPLRHVRVGDRDLGGSPCSSTTLTNGKGREFHLRVESSQVESMGLVRMTVSLAGRFDRCQGLRWRARVSFYAGTGLVCVRLTIHNPNRARHRGGLWDLGDPGSFMFRDLSLEIARPSGENGQVSCRTELGGGLEQSNGEFLEIYQDSSGGENWQSRNHVNREGRVPCRFQGYRATANGNERFGRRASPVLMSQADGVAVTVAVPEFWQQFPKALEVDGKCLRARLFPKQWDDLFELQGGERKTHTLWLEFASGAAFRGGMLDWVHQPARVLATPEWYADSRAIPLLSPATLDPDDRLQVLMRDALRGDKSFLAGREIIDEYGWRNFGDVWADHEQVYYSGLRPVMSHYNNQFDIVHGAILQMMRTGDNCWRDIWDPLARHVMDIDIYHTTKDKAAYNGGLFWLTDHYLDAATSTHRTYSRANIPKDRRPYGGGPGSEHNFASGLLDYYYLTGDPDAQEAVVGLADWVIRMDDGGRNVLRFVDDSPTGLASFCGSPDYHGPGRGSANSINVLLDAWVLTFRTTYLEKVEELIRRCIHPAEDPDHFDLLNAEMRWSYTMFLSALARYLDMATEYQLLGEMYTYARLTLLHYVSWMVEHEEPYLAHPERLEYPTEAWAAQEFRKANVFWLAARHAPEPLATQMRERARHFSARAWQDLLSFETRTVARSVALLMTEGTRDCYFRALGIDHVASLVTARGGEDWSQQIRQSFRNQRTKVREALQTPKGVLQVCLRLVSPTRWLQPTRRPLVS